MITSNSNYTSPKIISSSSFASSQPIWEEKRRWNYYKAVNNVVKELLEEEYSKAKENGTTKCDIAIPKTDLVVIKGFC